MWVRYLYLRSGKNETEEWQDIGNNSNHYYLLFTSYVPDTLVGGLYRSYPASSKELIGSQTFQVGECLTWAESDVRKTTGSIWLGRRRTSGGHDSSCMWRVGASVWPWDLFMIMMGKGPVKFHLHHGRIGWRLLLGSSIACLILIFFIVKYA